MFFEELHFFSIMWKAKWIGWNKLRRIGNSRAAKLSILAPFIPYIFSFIDSIIEIPFLFEYLKQFKVDWPKPKLNSLYWIYYGLIATAIGSLIYTLRCPSDIKTYEDEISFAEREGEFLVTTKKIKMIEYIQKYFSELVEVVHPGLSHTLTSDLKTWNEISVNSNKSEDRRNSQSLCQEYYLLLDKDRQFSGLFTLVFYIVGFLLISMPALGKFTGVTLRLLGE